VELLLILAACLKEWKHLSKANSWKLRIAKSAKPQASKRPGNQFVLITAKNVDFASSRWTITALGSTTV